MSRPRLTLQEFCDIVDRVVASLPRPFQDRMHNVTIDVEDRPSTRVLREQGLPRHAWRQILGYFEGVALTEQHAGEHHPNRVTLFQRSIEAACRSRDEVAYEVRRTVMHELAHHFGFSEEDLESFESAPSPFDEPS